MPRTLKARTPKLKPLYKVIRVFTDDWRCKRRIVARNLTYAAATAYVDTPASTSITAKTASAIKLTRRCGSWYDMFTRQE